MLSWHIENRIVNCAARSEILTYFINLSRGIAIDPTRNLRCYSTGQTEPYNEIGMASMVFELQYDGANDSRGVQVMIPNLQEIRRNRGVVNNILGHKSGSSIRDILSVKSFCAIDGDDFVFLQYIGSAVIYTAKNNRPFRSLALVGDDALSAANVAVPIDAARNDSGIVVLADTGALFL